ncbi:MAG TPA: gamma-glutamyltransferase family protein [Longimicrobiales bacterium]|nr:gamma-glutamyltransferase family protein [Longimicrobiales bacterium]
MTGSTMPYTRRIMLSVSLVLIGACASAPAARVDIPTASAAAYDVAPADELKRVVAQNGAVASANGLASDAGVEILRAGGNAVDAAIATAFAIGVVEPQMSGLGGSGSMLIWRQGEEQPYYLDFYAMQNAESFRGRTGDIEGPDLRIVGIPGEVPGLLEAHRRFGSLPLYQILAPAIRLAENGFPIGQILAQFIRSDSAKLFRYDGGHQQMWPGGEALSPGDIYRNPALAATLRAIAEHGRAGFDEGAAGRGIVATLNAAGHPATLADLKGFEPQWKRPLCSVYDGHLVLSAPPPQTGAQVLHTLNLLEPFDLAELGLPTQSARAFDVMVSALRVAQADNRGNDDPRWSVVPAAGRVSDAFADERRALVGTGSAPDRISTVNAAAYESAPPAPECEALRPWPIDAPRPPQAADDAGSERTGAQFQQDALPLYRSATTLTAAGAMHAALEDSTGETTHLSVVDSEGNAVALSQTNSTIFGSGAWVEGFFLNDSGYRFRDEESTTGGSSTWRTRTSTISPTIVLEDGRVRMVTGAPGSGRIPTEIAQTMVYVLDYGMDPIHALNMPRIYPSASSPRVQLEHGFPPELLAEIRRMGYDPAAESGSYARLYMIVRDGDRWIAVSDPRHDGQPRGY